MTTTSSRFPVKRLPDGRAFINLGSSARGHLGWNNVDFNWIVRLGKYPRLYHLLYRRGLLSVERYRRLQQMDPSTVVWDLRKGIPFADATFDGAYHCHVLEHIDREAAPVFIRECHRVLKPNGILRVVVPDFEYLARHYIGCVDRLPDNADMEEHLFRVSEMIDQMVIRTPRDRQGRPRIIRFAENIILGDTAKNGALHRWMYDRFSLAELLRECGFVDIRQQDATSSYISDWAEFHLDTEPDGTIYKPGSLYIEGRREG